MTKREKQIQSMLNYYGIDVGGTRDEKMNKTQKKNFLDSFRGFYDDQTVRDILQKVKDQIKDKRDIPDESDEDKDPFFDSLKNEEENTSPFPMDLNALSKGMGFPNIGNSKMPFGMNPDIENFINWISDTLYSADHKVVITEENGITNIRLEKIKKKRGGRKK